MESRIWTAALVSLAVLLSACAPKPSGHSAKGEHYSSVNVSGDAEKINLEEVHKAFFETSGKDFNSWMQNFEKRVNEVYEGEEIVGIDADKKGGMVRVSGFIDKNSEAGFQKGADDTIFELQQTGVASGEQGMPYQMTGHNGQMHHNGYPPPQYHHGLLDNPFVQMFVLSQLMRPNWGYQTPMGQQQVIRQHRQGFRGTPAYKTQATKNQGFFSRAFGKKQEALKSQRGFGGGMSSDTGTKKRSWFGGSSNDSRWSGRRSGSGSDSGLSWGGRRSSGFGGGGSSSWGGRRSSGRSFGGRRR